MNRYNKQSVQYAGMFLFVYKKNELTSTSQPMIEAAWPDVQLVLHKSSLQQDLHLGKGRPCSMTLHWKLFIHMSKQ